MFAIYDVCVWWRSELPPTLWTRRLLCKYLAKVFVSRRDMKSKTFLKVGTTKLLIYTTTIRKSRKTTLFIKLIAWSIREFNTGIEFLILKLDINHDPNHPIHLVKINIYLCWNHIRFRYLNDRTKMLARLVIRTLLLTTPFLRCDFYISTPKSNFFTTNKMAATKTLASLITSHPD